MKTGVVKAVCTSIRKGTAKKDIGVAKLIENYGLENDAHAGSERQVSLLSWDIVEAFKRTVGAGINIEPGSFGENLLVAGYDFKAFPIGTRFRCGDVLLELTQKGKTCHEDCEIRRTAGTCIMPKEGVFAIVLRGGYIKTGDKMDVLTDDYEPEDRFTDDRDSASEENPSIEKDTDTAGGIAPEPVQHPRKSFAEDPKESLSDEMKNPAGEDLPEEVAVSIQDHFIKRDEEQERDIIAGSERQSAESLAEKPGEHGRTNAHRSVLRAAVITVSDRSYKGEREDLSGPKICSMLKGYGYVVSDIRILPDEEDLIYTELVRLSDTCRIDIVFTTGGTGFSERDRTPEATMRAAERNAPGISEAIRAESMKHTKRAMLSRGASVIRGRTLIINLPGSPKAVEECLSFLLPELEHGILILKGEADG